MTSTGVRWLVIVISLASGRATTHAAAPADEVAAGAYLIVHTRALAAVAIDWARFRRDDGWQVTTVELVPDDDDDETRRAFVLDAITAHHRLAAGRPFAVLLLGDAGPAGIPTWYREQPDRSLRSRGTTGHATDNPYQLMNGDSVPDLALGRVPARTVDEALIVLDKIRAAEREPLPGVWRRRVAFAAGEGHFGGMDRVLELLFGTLVDRLVPDTYDVSMTYAKADSLFCPPPSQLADTVLGQISGTAAVFIYVGHGRAVELDSLYWGRRRVPILLARDLDRLDDRGGRRAIAVLTCCEAGWYDLPETDSLAEAMLFNPAGPLAVIAGSRVTHPYANTILQKDVASLLLDQRVPTVGELDLAACRSMLHIDAIDRDLDALTRPIARAGGWLSTLAELRRTHVELYNLLGDPATRVPLAAREVRDLSCDGVTVEGSVDGLGDGQIVVSIETARMRPVHADRMERVFGSDDPELERKARRNYALANERVIREISGVVVGGRFAITLDGPIPSDAAIVKVYAWGRDADGRLVDAAGAVRLDRRRRPAVGGSETP